MIFTYSSIKNNKLLRNTFNSRSRSAKFILCKLEDIVKRNWKLKWKDIPWSCIKRLHIDKVSLVPRFIYRFSAIPTRIPANFLGEIDQLILKFIWNRKWPRIAKIILKTKQRYITHTSLFQNLLKNNSN